MRLYVKYIVVPWLINFWMEKAVLLTTKKSLTEIELVTVIP